MSKGGAGKVYFVLYLAVILELLIIIVERDEAEEHLIQKQKESMRIVESILSQLQTGAGTEGISTQSKDEITLQEGGGNDGGPKIKQDRTYFIEVGVTDVFGTDKVDKEAEDAESKVSSLIKLANVQQLEYQVFYHPSENPEGAPYFPPSDSMRNVELSSEGQIVGSEADGNMWRLEMLRELALDVSATKDWRNPVYKDYTRSIGALQPYAPSDAVSADSVFRYSADYTQKIAQKNNNKVKKRAFVVRFQAPTKPGWYKLRFASKTNRILGVGGDVSEIPDDAKVNIGTVQLKVKDLRTVKKELERKLEGMGLPLADDLAKDVITASQFDQQLEQVRNRIANGEVGASSSAGGESNLLSQLDLYRYISFLLAPGKSDEFQQNRGSIEVDIRVIKPNVNIAEPYVELPPPVYYFDKLRPTFTFTSGPYMGNNPPEGRIVTPSGSIPLTVQAIDQTADAGGGGRGAKRTYRAVAQRSLEPGKYTIEVTQRNSGKTKTEQGVLEVFETALTEDNKKTLGPKMNFLFYGSTLRVEAEPTSLGRIPAGQFRTYLSTDKDQQKPAARGLAASVELGAAANSVSMRVTWVSPYTEEEIELYSISNQQIKQEDPIWDMSRVTTKTVGPNGKKLKVEIRDISIIPAIVDMGKEATAADIVGPELSDIKASVPGFDVAGSEIISQGDGRYSVVIELSGSAPKGETSIVGTVTGSISAKVKNPINGKISIASPTEFMGQVDTDAPSGRGGGNRPSAPQPRRRR